MANRVLGLKLEENYGVESASNPDFHVEVSKSKASLKTEPLTYTGGGRSIKKAKAGALKPEASFDLKTELKTIGYFLMAFLGNYKFTSGGSGPNIHEFWGEDNSELPSFTGWATFDYFMKQLFGMVCDTLKLDVSDEFLDGSCEWKYKTEKKISEVPSPANQKLIPDSILIAFYDIALELDNAAPPGVVSKFSFDGKNNLNTDKTTGIGSRAPQKKPNAQQREIKITLESTLVPETVAIIEKAEYGASGDSPSECKLYKLPMKLTIDFCEDSTDKLTIFFPECLVSVEYEASDADEMDAKFELQAISTKKITLADDTQILTDIYAKLENDQPEIKGGVAGTSTVSFTVKDNASTPAAVVGATLKLTNRQTGATLSAVAATNAQGQCVVNNVPYGRYDVELKNNSSVVVSTNPSIVSVNENTESLNLTANTN